MSSQASIPSSPSLIMEEISIRTISDVVKDFNTEKFIDYLGRKNLKLDKDDIKILHKEKIASSDFLELTEEKFHSIGFALGPVTRLTKFIKSLNQKLQNYSLLKSLDDLKEMLRRNKVNRKDILNINQFTPSSLTEIVKIARDYVTTTWLSIPSEEDGPFIIDYEETKKDKEPIRELLLLPYPNNDKENYNHFDNEMLVQRNCMKLEQQRLQSAEHQCTLIISSELEVLKQHITELEAENTELRKENTEILYFRNKLSMSDVEIAELKCRNIKFLRVNKEYNERHNDENAKLKARIEELEKNKEDSSAENVRRDVEIAEIKAKVVKLAEGAQVRDNNEETKQLTSH
ncbi:hypothetical protein C1645_739974 [Glomus cerebriforme]|uniref:SAM domain-containing protein n=1 Tax=Glomus cerebriforme TaxID=658196 RepID=A0A397SPL3_9GLOM|nr:hypothetical protein C1645_739974 [Glomus cerebriforme]